MPINTMEPRKLGDIKQFGIGTLFAVIGGLLTLILISLSYFRPPPSANELRPVPGFLASRVEIHYPSKGSPWASFTIKGATKTIDAHINNYNVAANCSDKPKLLQLEPGAEITAWFTVGDIAKRANAVVWRVQHGGEDMLSLEQSLLAYHDQERRSLTFSIGAFVLGIAFMLWGLRIFTAEQRRYGMT